MGGNLYLHEKTEYLLTLESPLVVNVEVKFRFYMLVFCLFLRHSYNLNQSLILGASVMLSCVPVCQPLKDKRMMMIKKKKNAAQQREGSRGGG